MTNNLIQRIMEKPVMRIFENLYNWFLFYFKIFIGDVLNTTIITSIY